MHNYTNQKNRPFGLVCFRCVDTLLFAPKHAEGMSLRYDALFPLLL